MKKMFKIGFAACLMAVVFSGCSKDDDNAEPDKKQKLLMTKLCEYTNGSGTVIQNRTDFQYDIHGRCTEIIEKKYIDGDEYSSHKQEYEYDENGNETKYERAYIIDGEIIDYIRTISKYNANGDQTEEENTNGDGKTYKKKWEYDEQGYTIKYLEYGSDGEISYERVYSYNGNVATYNDKRGVRVTEEYVCVNNHQLVKVYTSEEEYGIYKIVYAYDNEGKCISQENYDNDRLVLKINIEGNVYTFVQNECINGELNYTYSLKKVYTDSNQNKVLTIESSGVYYNGANDNWNVKEEYTYDLDGNEIEYVNYGDDQLRTKQTNYVYDGNKVTYTTYHYENGKTTPSSTYYTLIYNE